MEYFLSASGDMLSEESRIVELSLMVRICILGGDDQAAERYLKEAEDLTRACPSDFANHYSGWARATLMAHRGETQKAAESYQRASTFTSSPDFGEFLLEYGRFQASFGDRQQAERVLHEAYATLTQLSLKPLEEAAQQALRSIGSQA